MSDFERRRNYLNSVTPLRPDRLARAVEAGNMVLAQRRGELPVAKMTSQQIALEEELEVLQKGVYKGERKFEQMPWNESPLVRGGVYSLRDRALAF